MIIGVFVPNDSLKHLQTLLDPYKNITFEFFSYEYLDEVKELYQKNTNYLDGYFFSGLLSYTVIRESFGEFDKPVTYLKISEADFYKKLFEIKMNYPDFELNKVFIDFHVENKKIEDFIKSLSTNQRPLTLREEDIFITDDAYERIFTFHSRLHETNKIDWSFTRFANILDLLRNNNYKFHYFEISNETVHHTLMNLINEINLHVLQENQIVCGYLTINNVTEEIKEIKLLNLHSLLLNYNYKNANQLVIKKENGGFELITNHSALQSMTNDLSSCSLLHYLSSYFEESIHIGWGIGKTFIQAQLNAKQACDYSINNQLSNTFIVKGDNTIIGPLIGIENKENSPNILANTEKLEKLQTSLHMTRDKLNKILLAFYKFDQSQITSSQFAEAIGLSIRSANRILKEAEEKSLVIAEDDTQSGLQGRPRKIYRLNRNLL